MTSSPSAANREEGLRECPFCPCGGKPMLGTYVICTICGCEGPFGETEREAAEAWNRRSVKAPSLRAESGGVLTESDRAALAAGAHELEESAKYEHKSAEDEPSPQEKDEGHQYACLLEEHAAALRRLNALGGRDTVYRYDSEPNEIGENSRGEES